jgi:hypothetical protein
MPALGGGASLEPVATFDDDVIYQVPLEPAADGPRAEERPLREIRRDGWLAVPGANPGQGALAFDGDTNTAWSNVGDLVGAPAGEGEDGLAWLRGIQTWPEYRRAYLLEGRPQHFAIDLGQTVRPERVEVLLRVHQTPIFTPFVLSASMDGETFQRLGCTWHPVASLRLYAIAPAATWLRARCEAPSMRFLRLDQDPPSFRLYWELAELRLLVADE